MKKKRMTCGYCLLHQNHKGPVTTHFLVEIKMDEELKVRKQIWRCGRCGSLTEYFPRFKTSSRTAVDRARAMIERQKELKKWLREGSAITHYGWGSCRKGFGKD